MIAESGKESTTPIQPKPREIQKNTQSGGGTSKSMRYKVFKHKSGYACERLDANKSNVTSKRAKQSR
eukprot:4140930-Pleurochrysis_carterae.AAC.3